MNAMPLKTFDNYQYSNINLMLFNEIDNFIEVYNNSVIELIPCFGTSFFGLIYSNSDQRTRSQNAAIVQ